ncbi:MAG: anti-sigma factor family protein [Acidobacteriota bacterium]
MISCARFHARVQPLLEGEMGEAAALHFHLHAARCASCGTTLETARALVEELDAIGRSAAVPPTDLKERILRALAPVRPSSAPVRAAGWMAWATAMTLAAGVLWVGHAVIGLHPLSAPLFPGLRAALHAAGDWLVHFAALAQAFQLAPSWPPANPEPLQVHHLLPGLALILAGLAAAATALVLSVQSFSGRRQAPS